MKHWLKGFDQRMDRLSRAAIGTFAVCGVLIVGGIDYLSGFEVSLSLFYLGPVATAAWYAGRWDGVAVAVFSCISWYIADLAAGRQYSHEAIPVWNALVRLGFFITTAWLLAALRESFRAQQHLARTDSLTGLDNRRAFADRLEHDLALARRRKSALTLVYMDVDDFKVLNDTHGHAEGDRVLRMIAAMLRDSLRETDTTARLGGDEFAVVLPDIDGPAARHVVTKLARELHTAFGPEHHRITCSIGSVTFMSSAMSPEQAVAAADKLMYQVKREGKGTVLFSVLDGTDGSPGGVEAPPAARH